MSSTSRSKLASIRGLTVRSAFNRVWTPIEGLRRFNSILSKVTQEQLILLVELVFARLAKSLLMLAVVWTNGSRLDRLSRGDNHDLVNLLLYFS